MNWRDMSVSERIEAISVRRKQGWRYEQIAKDFGTKKTTLLNFCAKHGPKEPERTLNGNISKGPKEELERYRICQWPFGHPGTENFHFCGKPTEPGRPYCTEHCQRAYPSFPRSAVP